MQTAKKSGTIEAPAERVWNIVSNFGNLNSFVEAIEECKTDGSGVGAVRTLILQDGSTVKEKLESLNNADHTLSYSIVESAMPIKNYIGNMTVKDLGKNRSEFTWSSEFRAENGQEQEMTEALEELYGLGIEGLQNHFKSGE